MNLFDIMRQAQHGHGYDNMARQFGLSVAETQRAVEALLPAFSLGLQRSSTRPDAFANLLRMMTSGQYAPFYEAPSAGFWPQAQTSGNDVLGALFGSPDAIRRIAGQASSSSGIAQAVLQQMMPAMAAMLMGGLFRFASVEGFADFLRRWADWLMIAKISSPPPRRSAPANGADPFAPWIDMMSGLFGQTRAPAKAAKPARPPAKLGKAEPATDLWTDMARAWLGAQAPEPPPPPPPPPPPAQPNPFETLSGLFQTGRDVQAQQLASLQTVMETFWENARPR